MSCAIILLLFCHYFCLKEYSVIDKHADMLNSSHSCLIFEVKAPKFSLLRDVKE